MMRAAFLSAVLAAGLLPPQAPLPTLRLDQEGGVGGIRFGQVASELAGFEGQFRKQGKPRLSTQLYQRLKDTTQLGGLGRPDSYWFRQGRFVGVDVVICRRQLVERARQSLVLRYGLPRTDSLSGESYWLGQRTFILLDNPRGGRGCASVFIGSLAMLNELVVETAVQAQARQQLGWQPDSIGLPPQIRPKR